MATITVEVQKCKIDGCNKPATGKELCASHYRRLQQHGDPLHTARQFHGIPTKVVGISVPVALIEAATSECDSEKNEKAVTILARKLVEGSWGKAALNAAGIDMKNAGAVIVSRKPAEEAKPRKRKAKKESAATA
jgi:hypothetical protein